MEQSLCNHCKYAPDNLVFNDKCKKKFYCSDEYVDMRDTHEGNECIYYKKSFNKAVNDFIEKLYKPRKSQ